MATKFPAVGHLLRKTNPTTGATSHGLVVRSEPERGFVIVLDDESFETELLKLAHAC